VHEISTIIDIRSDRHDPEAPDFDSANIQVLVGEAGLTYRWMGPELAGATGGFVEAAVEGLVAVACASRSVVLCREPDPETCRRSTLLAPALIARDIRVLHVFPDGSVRPHELPLPFDR